MKKIEYPGSRLTVKENNALADEMVVVALNSADIDSNIHNFGLGIESKNSVLTVAVKSSKKNPLTETMHNIEEQRASLYNEGKMLTKAYSGWSTDIVKMEAGNALAEIFKRHGKVSVNLSHQDQTSIIGSFIKESGEASSQTYLSTIGMIEWYGALSVLHNDYKDVFLKKESYETNNENLSQSAALSPVLEKVRNLIDYLNGFLSLKKDDEQWIKIYNDIYGLVNRVNISSKIRRGNNKSNDEAE